MRALLDYVDSIPTAAAIVGLVIGFAAIKAWEFRVWRNRRRV